MSDVTNREVGSGLVVVEHAGERDRHPNYLILYTHTLIFYWWPVWVYGFIMAGLTWFGGTELTLWDTTPKARFYPNQLLGMVWVVIFLLVFLFTNVTMRGLVSGMVILGIAFLAVILAWLDLWDDILFIIPEVTVYMNLGFYLAVSIPIFVAWVLAFFVFDRMVYWRIEPGQVIREKVIGGAEQSWPSTDIVFEELHQDLFRHYLLGFGSSDLKMRMVRGGEDFLLPNVLFAHRKVAKIQNLIKRRPDADQ